MISIFLLPSTELRILSQIISKTKSTAFQDTLTTTISNGIFPSLVTKPNSYLYNPDEDEEIILDRVKRDPAPFVCKGKDNEFDFDLFYLFTHRRWLLS